MTEEEQKEQEKKKKEEEEENMNADIWRSLIFGSFLLAGYIVCEIGETYFGLRFPPGQRGLFGILSPSLPPAALVAIVILTALIGGVLFLLGRLISSFFD